MTVHLQGWVVSKRELAQVTFITVRTVNGEVHQCVCDELDDAIYSGSFVEVAGEFVEDERAPSGKELHLSSAIALSPVGEATSVSDLRSARRDVMRDGIIARSKMVAAIREYYATNSLLEVFTSSFTPLGAAAEGGANLVTLSSAQGPPRVALIQSPQLSKQALAGAGLGPGVYRIGSAFRADKSRSGHHLVEFSSCDIEIVSDSAQPAIDILCGTIQAAAAAIDAPTPEFVQMTYEEACQAIGVPSGTDFGRKEEKMLSTLHEDKWLLITSFPLRQRPAYTAPDGQTGQCFDLISPSGVEIASGSLRASSNEFKQGLIARGRAGQLHAFQDWIDSITSSPRTAGFGAGLDRIVAEFCGTDDVRNVTFDAWDYRRFSGGD